MIEGAVAAARPDDKVYVAYCPRCRTANKVPMQQLRRALPANWTPPATVEPAAPEAAAPTLSAEAQPAAPGKTSRRRADTTVDVTPSPEATPAAKKASRSKAKPS
ncbi:MAG: hypothetical protein IT317_15325 [Anaerolineales bacterium]|nr:hypothetical protein [Anaerolineales bacterium]